MVNFSKNRKATYVERVLGAFSQIQREHRKHAVHQASIRAHVKKIADRKNDKLGPNWASWVNKAVVKLENEGILEPTERSGNVILTPNGKKVISTARRSIRASYGGLDLENQDDLVWKQVATPQAKRQRQETPSGYDSDKMSSRKRARTSVGSSPLKKPIFKTTDTEGTKRKRVHERRDTSPLTDLDDDEDITNRLREELKERDEELEALRQELETARRTTAGDESVGAATVEQIPLVNRTHIPPPQSAPPIRQLFGGVARTQSGSIIPNLSKRPTPAPSSPGGRTADTGDTDIFAPGNDFFNEHDQSPDFEGEDMQKLRLEHDKALHDKNAQIKALQSELTDLRVLLAKGGDDIALGKEEIMKLKQELAGAGDTVSLKSSQVEDLEQQVVSLQEELQRNQNESETLRSSNARLQQEIGSLAATLREANDQIAALSATNADSETQIRNLAQSMKTSSEEVEILKQKLVGLELIASQYKEEVRVKEEACGRLVKDLQDKDLVIANSQSEMDTMQISFEDLTGRFSEAQATLSTLTLDLSQANNFASLVELGLAEMTDQMRKKEAEGASFLSEIAKLQGALASTRDDKDRLSAQLGDLDKEKQHVGAELQQAKQELSTVRTMLEGECQAKKELEAIIAGYVEKCDAVEEHIRRFEVSKQKDDTTIANLRNILERLRESHESQLQILKEVNMLW